MLPSPCTIARPGVDTRYLQPGWNGTAKVQRQATGQASASLSGPSTSRFPLAAALLCRCARNGRSHPSPKTLTIPGIQTETYGVIAISTPYAVMDPLVPALRLHGVQPDHSIQYHRSDRYRVLRTYSMHSICVVRIQYVENISNNAHVHMTFCKQSTHRSTTKRCTAFRTYVYNFCL